MMTTTDKSDISNHVDNR